MILALDFDGVIMDSAYECLITSSAAYEAEYTGLLAPVAVPVPESAFVRSFLKKRHLVRFAGEYWLLLHCLHTGLDPVDEQSFRAVAMQHEETVRRFEKLFFETRRVLVDSDYEAWLNLHRVYPEFSSGWDAVRERAEDVYVVSMKDRRSIAQLLSHYDIQVPEDHIAGREAGLHKSEMLGSLAVELGRDVSEFVFLDDHVPQLAEVSCTGVCCCWAAWGYSNNQATEIPAGIRICRELKDVLAVDCS